jgi:hypothetical protein
MEIPYRMYIPYGIFHMYGIPYGIFNMYGTPYGITWNSKF